MSRMMTANKKFQLLKTSSLLAAASAVLGLSLAAGCGGQKHAALEPTNRPADDAPITEPPIPAPVTANPLLGAKLYVDPDSTTMARGNSYKTSDPEKHRLLMRIAQEPQALWMGTWNSDIYRKVQDFVGKAVAQGEVAVFIAYNVPYRDYGAKHSEGGLETKEAYQRWIREIYAGIGDNPAVVVLEPDALPGVSEGSPLPENLREERLFLLNDAIRVLRQNPKVAVYIDAGHAAWVKPEEMAELLKKAGVEHASGFSINTSNYRSTEECLEYGHAISELIGDKHFVIDTSRNGVGPYLEAKTPEESWCNPPGRKIGKPPTTDTGDPLCDGFLWLKRPGESDGECNGGPVAGALWEEQALLYAE